ncbi:MAG: hypothetical protein ACRD0Y_01850 [Terriglobales bacterium]
MVRFRVLASLPALLAVVALGCTGGWAQSPPTSAAHTPAGQTIAVNLGHALQVLQGAVAALDAKHLHVPKRQQQALADGQASLMRNLTQATPGLLQVFRKEPENLGAAFRLYQDADAVLAVAQRSSAVLPPQDDAAGGAALRSATSNLSASLVQLGAWIEARGNADYAARHTARLHPAAAATVPAPATLVIQNANTAAQSKAKKAEKKKTKPSIPHR